MGEIDRGKMARMLGGSRRERVEWLMKGGEGKVMRMWIMRRLGRIWYSYEGGGGEEGWRSWRLGKGSPPGKELVVGVWREEKGVWRRDRVER